MNSVGGVDGHAFYEVGDLAAAFAWKMNGLVKELRAGGLAATSPD